MRWVVGIGFLAAVIPGTALADRKEVQLAISPEVAILTRGERTRAGPGASLRVSYGLRDWLSVEGVLGCGRVDTLEERDVEVDGRSGRVVYDATRCLIGPGLAGRLGSVVVGTLSVGLAYRYEHASTRDLVASNNVLLLHLEDEGSHALVAPLRAGVEYRPWDWLTVGAEATARLTLAGGPVELDLGLGATLGVYFYP